MGEPVVVVRGTDGAIRALNTACRHRAMPVVTGRGNARRFVCPYHSWAYATDGRLIVAPHMEGSRVFSFALAVQNGGTVLLPDVVAPSSGGVVRPGQPVLRLQPDAEAETDEQAEQDNARQARPEPPGATATRPDDGGGLLKRFAHTLCLLCGPVKDLHLGVSHHVLEVHRHSVHEAGVPLRRDGLCTHGLVHRPDRGREVLDCLRRVSGVADALGQDVDMAGDVALGLRELLCESALRRRLISSGARGFALVEEAAQRGDVLGQCGGAGVGPFLRLEDGEQGGEEKPHVRGGVVAGRLPALASLNLAFDLFGVGPVVRHGRGDSGGSGRTAPWGRIG